ncbi:hypothetical protein [Desulfovibrio falkowii]|uniref:P27 family phage terminase small subunit n=1 Tax=Desulfovibrio falkowii TaxID=3136602 RepID=A0ABQ0EA06_9BACT
MSDTTTITPEERLERLVKTAREALANYKSAKKTTQPRDGETIKASRLRGATANEKFRQHERYMHEIHCLAVELGLAAPQPERYGERRMSLGFGREIREIRREPEGYKND